MGFRDRLRDLGNRTRNVSDDVRLRAMLAGDKLRGGAGTIKTGAQRAYQHPVTQGIGGGIKRVGSAGAGLMGGLAFAGNKVNQAEGDGYLADSNVVQVEHCGVEPLTP